MNKSAFAGLGLTEKAGSGDALDQRLFVSAPSRSDESAQLTTEQRVNATTLSRDNAATETGADKRTLARDEEAPLASSKLRSRGPARERSLSKRHEAPLSVLRSQRPLVRTVERHSHDIFQDQVRWMNRLKLDLEERYGAKVTGNAMVQLALDLFRDDFLNHGDDSSLVRALVRGGSWQPARHDAKDDGEEEGGR